MSITIFCLLVFIDVYMIVRNLWVFHTRQQILFRQKNTHIDYDHLPEYYDMLIKYFWIWNVNKFPGVKNDNNQ